MRSLSIILVFLYFTINPFQLFSQKNSQDYNMFSFIGKWEITIFKTDPPGETKPPKVIKEIRLIPDSSGVNVTDVVEVDGKTLKNEYSLLYNKYTNGYETVATVENGEVIRGQGFYRKNKFHEVFFDAKGTVFQIGTGEVISNDEWTREAHIFYGKTSRTTWLRAIRIKE